MTATIQSGTYIIISKVHEGHGSIGRNLAEDRSLLPKKVVLLPPGVEDQRWEIERLPDGHYILKTRGSHAAKIGDHLFGVLLPEPVATRWKIEPQPHDKDTYTIAVANEPSERWVLLEDKPFTQVSVKAVNTGPLPPPHFPLNHLFIIRHAPY